MLRKLFMFLFNLKGWRVNRNLPKEAFNCVMVGAPHTSNWDFIFTIPALEKLEINSHFAIKKEFNKGILGKMIQDLGAIWIDRNPDPSEGKRAMTYVMADLFKKQKEKMALLIPAEGTRSLVKKWKTGFYYVALKAQVPICLSYLDYKKKEAGVGVCFMPTGNLEQDMRRIMDFYRDIPAKFPENFGLDVRYS